MLLKLNHAEYSRYELGLGIITAAISAATPGTYTLALVREDGYGDVQTASVILAGATGSVVFDLATLAADSINYHRTGAYHVEARDGANAIVATSTSVDVVVLTVERFKRSYLLGVPLYVEGVLMVVKQPSFATVLYVDPGTLKGKGTLAYVHAAHTVSWRGGEAEPYVAGDTVRLLNLEADSYIELLLGDEPSVDTSTSLLIDNLRLTDADLRIYLVDAYNTVQQKLQIALEATIFSSLAGDAYADITIDQQAYLRGQNRSIQLLAPQTRPLRAIRTLAGYYAGQSVLTVPLEWMTIEEKAGMISLLPVAGASVFATSIWGVSGWNIRDSFGAQTPDFWHITGVSGLRSLDKDGRSIREAIGKYAALAALQDLSLAATTGRTSFAAQREGVSENWSYGAQGAYGEKITAYSAWLDVNLIKLRQYFGGLLSVVL